MNYQSEVGKSGALRVYPGYSGRCIGARLRLKVSFAFGQLKNENTMKRFLWLSSICFVLPVFLPGRRLVQWTGERLSVKTGTDPDATLVILHSTTTTTVAALSRIAAPAT